MLVAVVVFLVAAAMEHRKYIGIEKNQNVMLHKVKEIDYIQVCADRLAKVLLSSTMIKWNLSYKDFLTTKYIPPLQSNSYGKT